VKIKSLRLLSAAAASVMLMSSCASGPAVLSYKDSVITENEFVYYLATYKASFLNTYSDFEDKAAFYSAPLGDTGMTGEEFIFESILRNVKMSLVCDALADEYGLAVNESTVQVIDDYIDDFIYEYAGGSKNQFNQALSRFGINADMLREIYLRDERGTALYSYLYGDNGTIGITDSDRKAYLDENYVRVRHIYVNNSYTYAVDEDGIVMTNEDGTYKTVPLEGEVLEAKNAAIEAIDSALASGEDFDAVYSAYSEDKLYENGYYITRNMNFVSDVVVSAFELETGKYVKLTSDVGTHYIMRLEMDEKPWSDEKNADFFADYDTAVSSELFAAYVESQIGEVVVNEEILAGYSVEDSDVNYRF